MYSEEDRETFVLGLVCSKFAEIVVEGSAFS